MPFNMNLRAKTTGDGSCGLHCFVTTVDKILQNSENTHTKEKEKLADAFKAYYGITQDFTGDNLAKTLSELDPKEKEALLSPVLRKILVDSMIANPPHNQRKIDKDNAPAELNRIAQPTEHLRSGDLAYLAYELGVDLESFEGQRLKTGKDGSGKDIAVELSAENSLVMPKHLAEKANQHAYKLKIRHEKAHWEFEMNCAKTVEENQKLVDAHNQYYRAEARYFHAKNLALALKNQVKSAVEKKQSLKSIYNLPHVIDRVGHSENIFTSGGTSAANPFTNISSMLDGLLKSLSGSPNESSNSSDSTKSQNIFSGILNIFANVIKFMFGFAEIVTQIGKAKSHEYNEEELSLLSDEQRSETLDFMEKTQLLAAQGGFAQTLASSLNKEWKQHIQGNQNRDKLWLKLIETLKSQGKTDEALALLKQREQVLIEKLSQEGESDKKEDANPKNDGVQVPSSLDKKQNADKAQPPASAKAANVKQKPDARLISNLRKVVGEMYSLENMHKLGASNSEQLKSLCLSNRLDLYRESMKASKLEDVVSKFNSFNTGFNAVMEKEDEASRRKENPLRVGGNS